MKRRVYRTASAEDLKGARNPEGFWEPTKRKTIKFDDGFANSGIAVDVVEGADWESARARFEFYGEHLIDRVDELLALAHGMGCPDFSASALLTGQPLDASFANEACRAVSSLIEACPEGTPDWLILQFYYRWLSARMHLISDTALVLKEILLAGSIAREFELAGRNKDDASRGKLAVESASKGGKARSVGFGQQRQAVISEMKRLMTHNHSKSRAAELAAANGIGTSRDANIKVFDRYSGKS